MPWPRSAQVVSATQSFATAVPFRLGQFLTQRQPFRSNHDQFFTGQTGSAAFHHADIFEVRRDEQLKQSVMLFHSEAGWFNRGSADAVCGNTIMS
mmetsp:Transcript_27846/g.78046  ORF Transcript_27846/g.78046 Transcript_27846/m.78046 type:complete len:95 (+) Transcript_27846:713-997(+)